MIDKHYLIKALDDKIFKMLFRTLKEVNYSYITSPNTDSRILIKENCFKIREEYSHEYYFENIKYWPNDLRMGEEVKLLFLARVANISYNILKEVESYCLLTIMRANGFGNIFNGIKESIDYLVQHGNETILRDLHEIKDALELGLRMNFSSSLDARENIKKLENLTIIN